MRPPARKIGEGRIGEIFGNEERIYKSISVSDPDDIKLVKNEIRMMEAFKNFFDISGIYRNQCHVYFDKGTYDVMIGQL